MELIKRFTLSATKWERLPISVIRCCYFMKSEWKRRDRPSPPLFDISRDTVNDNGSARDTENEEPIAVTNCITTSDTAVLPSIPDYEDVIGYENVSDNPYHDVTMTLHRIVENYHYPRFASPWVF